MYVTTIVFYTAITVTTAKVWQVPQSDLESPHYPALSESSAEDHQRQIQFLNCNPDSALTAFDSVILKIRCRNLTPEFLRRIYGDTEAFPRYEKDYRIDGPEPEDESEDVNDKIKRFVEKYNKKTNVRKKRPNANEHRAIIENEINDKLNQIDDVNENEVVKDEGDENEQEREETNLDEANKVLNKYSRLETDPLLVFKINLIHLTDSINKRILERMRKEFIKRSFQLQDGSNYGHAYQPSYGQLYLMRDINEAGKGYMAALNKIYLETQEDPTRKLSKRTRKIAAISANFPSPESDSDILQPASKRVFSLLTRWKPFTTLGQDAELRRRFHAYGYFPQFTRHGDIVSAETRASSRPPGSPLRWG